MASRSRIRTTDAALLVLLRGCASMCSSCPGADRGVLFIALLGVVAAGGPWLAPQDPIRLRCAAGCPAHARGTMAIASLRTISGDVLSRVITLGVTVIGFSAVVTAACCRARMSPLRGPGRCVIMSLAAASSPSRHPPRHRHHRRVARASHSDRVIGLSAWVSYARISLPGAVCARASSWRRSNPSSAPWGAWCCSRLPNVSRRRRFRHIDWPVDRARGTLSSDRLIRPRRPGR